MVVGRQNGARGMRGGAGSLRRRLLAGVVLVLACTAAAGPVQAQTPPAEAASAVQGAASVQAFDGGGFARMIFTFEGDPPEGEANISNGILVVTFSSPVTVSLDKVAVALPAYIGGSRRDQDGKAVRLVLTQRVSANTMAAGKRLFVDLLPTSWTGPPPTLPKDIIDELNTKAREAMRLEQEAADRRKNSPPRTIELRAATLPTFSRLTFDVGATVPVTFQHSGREVTVTFDAPLHADVGLIRAVPPPRLETIDTQEKDARFTVKLGLADKADVRAFWDGTSYLVDLTDSEAGLAQQGVAAQISRALPQLAPVQTTKSPAPPEEAPHAPPATIAPAAEKPPAPQPPGGEPPAAKAELAPAVAAAPLHPPVPPGGEPAAAAPVSAPHDPPAPAARPESVPAAPVVAAAPPAADAPLRPAVTVVGQTVRLSFPFDRRTPAAVFRRADTLWLVFDTSRKLDAAALAAAAPEVVASSDLITGNGVATLRLKLKKTPLTTMAPDGLGWIVSIGDDILGAAQPVALRRQILDDGRTQVTAQVEGAGSVHRLADPDANDQILVVTAGPPGRAFLKSQQFVEFRTLVTAHGLAFLPASDDINVAVSLDQVTVTREGGLTLSPNAASEPEPVVAAGRTLMVDPAAWQVGSRGPFRERERDFLTESAAAEGARKTQARMRLSGFYLARGLLPEAVGVLDTTDATDAEAAQDPRFVIMRAAAHAREGRADEVKAILEAHGLANNGEGALWLALADAAAGKFAEARQAFRKGLPAIGLYPKDQQATFRMAGFEAELEAGDSAVALTQQKAIEDLDIEPPEPQRFSVLKGRLAALLGHSEEALAEFQQALSGRDPKAVAEATLRALPLKRAAGAIDDKAMLDQLEKLQAAWRGDDVEARTLALLVDAHLKAGDEQAAFGDMRTAETYFPGSDTTRAMEDKLKDRFIALFLDGEADKMKPIDALALFYDFRNLTPTDNRGDEMIRKLADRLVKVDLLDQASELLQHQIDNRLSGAGRAQVAAKLAVIQLMNHKPSQALQTLSSTRQSDLPRELSNARLIIEARALAETGQADVALEMLDQVEAANVAGLKADILWQAQRWPEAGEALEGTLGESWQAPEPLTDLQRVAAMRAAIAYSLAEDKIGLDRLRTKYTQKMANSADGPAFEVVTAPIESRGSKFSDIARKVAATDMLEAFIKDYQARFSNQPLPDAGKPAAAVDPKATAG